MKVLRAETFISKLVIDWLIGQITEGFSTDDKRWLTDYKEIRRLLYAVRSTDYGGTAIRPHSHHLSSW